MEKISAKFKIVTPLFLGGAEPEQKAELRPSSIKGALRFWYRAIDPEYKEWEEKIFGSTKHGQGLFSVKMDLPVKGCKKWVPSRYDPFNKNHPNIPSHLIGNNLSEKQKNEKRKWTINGVRYLAYTFQLGDNKKRKYIAPCQNITLSLLFKGAVDGRERKAILSSIWLLGHLGGLGSRSRRGFGTISLQSIETDWEEANELEIANGAKQLEDWKKIFIDGIQKINEWFPKKDRSPDHSIISDGTRFFVFDNGYKNEKHNGTDFSPWEVALNEAGKSFQCFRQRYEPDYNNIKNNTINAAPERTAFGLPFASRNKTFIGFYNKEEYERNASSLHIRVIECGAQCHLFFILMDAPLIKIRHDANEYDPPSRDIFENFIEHLKNDYKICELPT